MPEELWQEAVRLARVHGVSPVATPLRLNFYGMKKRLEAMPEVRKPIPRKSGQAKFIELRPAGGMVPPAGCVVEVEGAGGARMTIRLGGGSGAELAALVSAFLGWKG